MEYKPPLEAKKRGAVIGSAPKLNPEGLLAAAREAEAKAKEELKRKVFSISLWTSGSLRHSLFAALRELLGVS